MPFAAQALNDYGEAAAIATIFDRAPSRRRYRTSMDISRIACCCCQLSSAGVTTVMREHYNGDEAQANASLLLAC